MSANGAVSSAVSGAAPPAKRRVAYFYDCMLGCCAWRPLALCGSN